ncbi:MAG: D-alanyl-D-alanine carboxypeptidase [Acetobacteraceae bacterium]|nr:D-alanyl-D-alanine carboxypeptidase [Acetobacteraceae bacterium]
MRSARTKLRDNWPRRTVLWLRATLAMTGLGIIGFAGAASAQIGSARYASIVVDARTGAVLSAVNADELRYPASLTKVMTLYMAFDALRDRRISLHQLVPVSAEAAAMSPTKLGLVPGGRITVEQAILGLVTKSANDAAAALGEMLGGNEDRFAEMMTLRARALGMTQTSFRNASGLPDGGQVSTARDLALLGRRIIADFPAYYGYFSTAQFRFHGRIYRSHDRLRGVYPGADGLKTGYTVASGFNLVTSAARGGVRLVGVVLGGANGGERDNHMMALLDQGFERMDVPIRRRDTTATSRFTGPIGTAHAASSAVTARTASRFGIQVGSFPSEQAARVAALAARRLADAGEARVQSVRLRGKTSWRAQVTNLSVSDAQETCSLLARRKTPCIILRPEQGQFASR